MMTATLHRRHARAWGLGSTDEHWGKQAACRGEDPDLWTHIRSTNPVRRPSEDEQRAIDICNQCLVRAECYRDAADAPWETTGVIRAGLYWPLRLNPGHRREPAPDRPSKAGTRFVGATHCRWCNTELPKGRARLLCGDACRAAERLHKRELTATAWLRLGDDDV